MTKAEWRAEDLRRKAAATDPANKRYTAIVRFENDPDLDEEIDVDACDRKAAKLEAERQLSIDYKPGGRVLKLIGPRVGLYL